jgi:AcrR family transcriptional regulator
MWGMVEHAANRAQLIERLSLVFESFGYEGATLTQLAAAAGMSKSSLYHHFPGGKHEMAEALLRHATGELQRQAFARLQGPERPSMRLAAFLTGFASYVANGRGHCLLAVLAQGSARTDLGGEIAAQYRDWLKLLTQVLEESGLKPKRAHRVAEELINQLYGSLIVGKMLNDPDHFKGWVKRLEKSLRKT